MPRTYEVRQDKHGPDEKFVVWLLADDRPAVRAHVGHRFDTKHEAEIIAADLREAFEAGRLEGAMPEQSPSATSDV